MEQTVQPQRSLSQRRRDSGKTLDKLHIPPLDESQEVIEMSGIKDEGDDVIEEGRELFTNFLSTEIAKSPEFSEEQPLRAGYKNPLWAKTGRDLRLMADDFAKTQGRVQVQERAREMGTNVTFEDFHDLLSQTFSQGGITRERIVVLFFFCSDVAIIALREGKNLFQRFLNWSLNFISDVICRWVQQNGGWGKVLSQPFNSVNKVVFWVTLVVGLFIAYRYYRRRIL